MQDIYGQLHIGVANCTVGIHTTFFTPHLFQGWCIAFSSVLLIPVMAVRAYVRAAEQTGPGGSFKTVSNYRNMQLDVQV